MLAHLKKIEWLCCCQGPVAYAHRQRSVALRAKTDQKVVTVRLQWQEKPQQRVELAGLANGDPGVPGML